MEGTTSLPAAMHGSWLGPTPSPGAYLGDGYARKVAFNAALAASMNGMTYKNDTVTWVLAGTRGNSLEAALNEWYDVQK